jgi:dTMP kinase
MHDDDLGSLLRRLPAQCIAFDGPDGGGKTSQIAVIVDRLKRFGIDVIRTREPGGSAGAEVIRAMMLSDQTFSPTCEAMMMSAARADHVDNLIRPAMARNQWVITDRFSDSTEAYQGWGQGADINKIRALTALIGFRPDVTVILDVGADVSVQRMLVRGASLDRFESLGEEFFERVARGYRSIAAENPGDHLLISSLGKFDDVSDLIWNALVTWLSTCQDSLSEAKRGWR